MAFAFAVLVASPLPAQDVVPASDPSIELPAELARVLRDYERMWTAKDAAGLARLFA